MTGAQHKDVGVCVLLVSENTFIILDSYTSPPCLKNKNEGKACGECVRHLSITELFFEYIAV